MEGDNNKMKLRSRSIEVEVTLKGNEILRSNQQLVCKHFLETKGHLGNEKLVGSKLNFMLKIGIEMCFLKSFFFNVDYCLENMNCNLFSKIKLLLL